MSIVPGYTQPNTGAIDWIFGGGLVALLVGIVAFMGWGLAKLFGYVWPKTVGKIVEKDKKNDRKK